MKAILLLAQCIALTFSAQAWAISDSKNCEERSQQLRGAAKESFLSSCLSQTLEQTSAPARVQAVTEESKQKTCEQNAKNMKMDAGRKASYMNECMHSNEAAAEARKAGVKEHLIASKPAPQHAATAQATPQKAVASEKQASKHSVKKHDDAKSKVSLKTCVKQANKEQLKGKERKNFISECRKG